MQFAGERVILKKEDYFLCAAILQRTNLLSLAKEDFRMTYSARIVRRNTKSSKAKGMESAGITAGLLQTSLRNCGFRNSNITKVIPVHQEVKYKAFLQAEQDDPSTFSIQKFPIKGK